MQFQLNPASISCYADADMDGSGFGAFDEHLIRPPAPAEACTDIGTDESAPLPGFAEVDIPHVIACTLAAIVLMVLGRVYGGPDEPAASMEAVADSQAAAYGYGTASSGAKQ